MNEVIVNFGPEGNLAGTLALPAGTAKPVGMLLLNAGVIHRMGPHRMNVKLARRAAEAGFASLRFDFPGQGESVVVPARLPFEQQAVLDIGSAMTCMQRVTGLERFVIVGICSGAHHGQNAALSDPRIVGLWMLDGYFYTTTKTLLVRLYRRFAPSSLPTLLPWLVRRLRLVWKRLRARLFEVGDTGRDEGVYRFPSRESYAAAMNTLSDRNVDMCLMFSGSMTTHYNYPGQLADGFPGQRFVERVECEIDPQLDHTLSTLDSQKRMIERVLGWLDRVAQRVPNRPSGSMTA